MQLQRLRDLPDPVAPELAAARDLLRPTRPLVPSDERMQRVRQALRTRVPPPALVGSSLLLKATLLLLAAGLAAGLLLGRPHSPPPRFQSPALPPVVPPAAPAPGIGARGQPTHPPAAPPRPPLAAPLTAPAARLHRRPRLENQRAGLPAAPPPGAPAASPVAAAAPPLSAATRDAPPVPAVEISDEVDPAEAALVLSATQVLRQRAEPARALALLSEYQRRFPQGALQEEALALNLECLVALSDPRAGARAREYLRRYPAGRFRAFAAAAAARYPAAPPAQE